MPPPPLIAVSGTLELLFSTLPAAVGTLLGPCGPGLAMARGAVVDRLDSFRIVDEVSARRYDIGIVDGLPEQMASLESLRLCPFTVYAYVPKANPLAGHGSLVIQDLDRQTVVTPGPHSHLQRVLLDRCAETGVDIRIRAEINNCTLALEAAKGWGAIVFGLAPLTEKTAPFAAVPLACRNVENYGLHAVRPSSGRICTSAALLWDTLAHRTGRP